MFAQYTTDLTEIGTTVRRVTVLAGLTAVLAACSTGLLSRSAQDLGLFAVGENLLRESCRVEPGGARNGFQRYNVKCGKWENASARIYALPEGEAPGGPAQTQWRAQLATQAECSADQVTTVLDGLTARSVDCKLRNGGWPYQGLIVSAGDRTYVAEGIPAAMGAATRGIGVLSGTLNVQTASSGTANEQEIAALKAKLGTDLFTINDVFQFQSLLQLAQYFNYQGNYAQAAEKYREALVIQRRILPNDLPRQGYVLMHLALEQSNQGRFGGAESLFRQAEQLVDQSTNDTDKARLTSYRAIHLANQRQFQDALKMARQATKEREDLVRRYPVDTFEGTAIGRFSRAGSSSLQSLGASLGQAAYIDLVQSQYLEAYMLARLNRRRDALSVISRAEQRVRNNTAVPRRWLSRLLFLKAELAEGQGNTGSAARYYSQAAEVERSVATDSRLQAMALVEQGRLELLNGNTQDGLSVSRQGFEILGRTERNLTIESMVPYFNAVLRTPVSTGEQVGPDREAFQFAQLVRSPVVAKSMALSLARLAAGDTEGSSVIRSLQDLQRKRDQATADLTKLYASQNVLSAPKIEQQEKQIKAYTDEIRRQETLVQAALPRYHTLTDKIVQLQDLQAILEEDEAVSMFLVADSAVYGFYADQSTYRLYDVGLNGAQVADLVKKMRFSVDEVTLARYDSDAAVSAYDRLFGPVMQNLADKRRLTIVPTGALSSLPFSMLLTDSSAATGTDYSAMSWMIKQHAISVMPSIQAFYNSRTEGTSSNASRSFVGFGGDTYKSFDPVTLVRKLNLRARCRRDARILANLPELAGAADELRQIANQVGAERSQTFRLSEFSEENLKSFLFDDYRVIHFATHGLLPEQLDCWPQPALVLGSLPTDAGSDGLLDASEIIDLKLDADLVILSACNTGALLEDEFGGEGLASLTRAFLYAGARGLIVTHWSIADTATRDLMVVLFRGLKDEVAPVDALRDAKLSLISNPKTAHPYYWSAFALVGKGDEAFNL